MVVGGRGILIRICAIGSLCKETEKGHPEQKQVAHLHECHSSWDIHRQIGTAQRSPTPPLHPTCVCEVVCVCLLVTLPVGTRGTFRFVVKLNRCRPKLHPLPHFCSVSPTFSPSVAQDQNCDSVAFVTYRAVSNVMFIFTFAFEFGYLAGRFVHAYRYGNIKI